MIKRRGFPTVRRVALGTIVRELVQSVVRIVGFLIIGLMAGPAIGRRAVELTPDMTLRTIGIDVRSGQREIRTIVIECGRLPSGGAVALVTGMTELTCHMVGIHNLLII